MRTTRYALRPICKQEVTGSIPVGSTRGSGAADALPGAPAIRADAGQPGFLVTIEIGQALESSVSRGNLARLRSRLHQNRDSARDFVDRKSTRLNSSHLVISYA